MANIIDRNELGKLLKARWASFLNKTELMRQTLECARHGNYKTSPQAVIPAKQVKISITTFDILSAENSFEVWVEFNLPMGAGVLVGTHVFHLKLDGDLSLQQTYGTLLVPNESDNV